MSSDLNARMLAAHARADHAALISLYTEAADRSDDLNEACFFLTHAYIYALEAGASEAGTLHRRLVAQGREQ